MNRLSDVFAQRRWNRLGTIFAILFCLSWVAEADAQDKPRFEVYGGYSVLRVKLPDTIDGTDTQVFQSVIGSLLGWNAGVTTNITRHVGITSDFSGYYRKIGGDIDGDIATARANLHSLLFGPRFSGSGDKVRPFGHALFGIGRVSGSAAVDNDESNFHNSGFAMAFGGGVDFVVDERFAIRAIEFDYFPTRQTSEDINRSGSLTLNNFRFGTGVVILLKK